MSGPADEPPVRPAVRRVGRRRVVSGAAPLAQPPDADPSSSGGSGGPPESVRQTRDDTDEGWSRPGDDDHDAWLLRQRPPHWG